MDVETYRFVAVSRGPLKVDDVDNVAARAPEGQFQLSEPVLLEKWNCTLVDECGMFSAEAAKPYMLSSTIIIAVARARFSMVSTWNPI